MSQLSQLGFWMFSGTMGAVGIAATVGVLDRPANNAPIPKTEIAGKPANSSKSPEKSSDEKVAKLSPEKKSEPAKTKPEKKPVVTPPIIVPSFDILRVEKDGSTLIAGRAQPDSTIEIFDGVIIVASTNAGSNGDFVAILEKPLSPGDHHLGIRATGKDSKVQVSAETGLVSVPAKKDGELLAMVMKPGEASRIIQKPAAQKPVKKVEPAKLAPVVAPGLVPSKPKEKVVEITNVAPESNIEVAMENPVAPETKTEIAIEKPVASEPTAPVVAKIEIAPAPNKKPMNETAPKPAVVAETEIEPAAKPAIVAKTESEPAAKPAAVAKIESEPAAKPAAVAEIESKPAAKPAAVAEIESKPAAKPAAVAKIESEPAAKPAAVAEIESEPAAKPAAVAETESEPAAKPAVVAKPSVKETEQVSAKVKPAKAVEPIKKAMPVKEVEPIKDLQVATLAPPKKEEAISISKPEVAPVEKSIPEPKGPTKKPAVQVEPEKAEPEIAPTIIVEAVEIDGPTMFIAGAAEPGRRVAIYVDNKFVGFADGSREGRFLLEVERKLSRGEHLVRADIYDAKGNAVAARAEVPLIHEPEEPAVAVAKVEPAPKPEIEQPNTIPTKKPARVAEKAPPTEGKKAEVAKVAPASTAAPETEPAKEMVASTAATVPIIEKTAKAPENPVAITPGKPKTVEDVQVAVAKAEKKSADTLVIMKPTKTPVVAKQAEPEKPVEPNKIAKTAPLIVPEKPKAVPTIKVAKVAPAEATEKPVEAMAKTSSKPVTQPVPEMKNEVKIASAAQKTAPARRVLRTGSSVIIRRGDSLWRISYRTYGRGIRYSTIYQANLNQLRSPHKIYPGQILKVPKKKFEQQG